MTLFIREHRLVTINKKFEPYELISLSALKPTELYPLQPIGIGTSFVESKTSYVNRLAEAHSVTIYTLVKECLAKNLGKKYLVKRQNNVQGFFQIIVPALNGVSMTSEQFTEVVQELTGVTDLHLLTMLPWNGCLSNRDLIRHKRAWCPRCFEAWKTSGAVLYEPLIWNLKVMDLCPLHASRLETVCPACKCENPVLNFKSRVGYCSICGSWLGQKSGANSGITLDDFENCVNRNICQMLREGASNGTQVANRQIQLNNITAITESAGGPSGLARRINIHRHSITNWCNGSKVPTLRSLLFISFVARVPLTEILTSVKIMPDLLTTDPGIISLHKGICSKGPRQLDLDKIRADLGQILKDNSVPPLSVQEVAAKLDCHLSYLYTHFPELCRAIASKHRDYLHQKSKEKENFACQTIMEVTLRIYEDGGYPSQARIQREMAGRGLFWNQNLSKTWHETKRELGLF